ncbi:MAG: hypothetical protein HN704_14325 [Bacteroidetes bacterium]|jgi:hypothetical protein|nr:hypothetical protein [Bacteroidota bacterium]MBT6686264.1 hypothetical protein [Bacteroidota bacterium]MBT7142642.1 hypothetical protein [Bacteroidota bacterium]MBT7492772.1 hypothetical protein [Bacteroidota bacterium]
MAKIKANKKSLIRWKVYVDRARMYVGYIQFIMIGFVLLEAYRESYIGNLIFDNLIISIPVLFLIFIILSLLIGRLDTVIGLREEELRNSAASNPMFREIHANIEQIKNELQELKNQNLLNQKNKTDTQSD